VFVVMIESLAFNNDEDVRQDLKWVDLIECGTYDMTNELLVVKNGTYEHITNGPESTEARRPFELIAYPLTNVGRIEISVK